MSRWAVPPAEVALGELEAEEREAAERLLREDPAFRAEVERARGLVRALGTLAPGAGDEGAVPPLDLGSALASRPGRRRRLREPVVLRPAVAALAAIALVAAGAGAGALLGAERGADGRRPGPRVELRALVPVARPMRAEASLPRGPDSSVHFRAGAMPRTAAREHYELWLLGADGRMVSLGTFRVGPGGVVDLALPLGVDPRRYAYLDVSVEPDDGDPRHSGRSVLRSRVPA